MLFRSGILILETRIVEPGEGQRVRAPISGKLIHGADEEPLEYHRIAEQRFVIQRIGASHRWHVVHLGVVPQIVLESQWIVREVGDELPVQRFGALRGEA